MQQAQQGDAAGILVSDEDRVELAQRKHFSYLFFGVKLAYTIIVFFVVLSSYLALPNDNNLLILGLDVFGLLAALGCLILIRRGFVTVANSIIFALDIAIALAWAHRSGGTYSGVSIFLFSLYAAQAFLLPRRIYLTIGGMGIAAYVILTALELSDLLPPISQSSTSTYLFNYILTFLALLAIASYFSSNLQGAVIRLRQQQGVLGQANSLLTSQERTRELASLQVITAASELAQQADKQAERAARTAAEVNQANALVRELSVVAETITASAHEVSTAAAGTISEIGAAQHSIAVGRQVIEQLVAQVSTIAAVAQHLAERARSLNTIVESIENIADSTRLLSLNASIEAVSAGPQGVRFNVIAREVQELALSSNVATEEVRRLLNELEAGVVAVTEATGHGLQMAAQGSQEVRMIDGAITRIADLSAQTSRLAAAISQVTVRQQDEAAGAAQQMQTLLTLAAAEADGAKVGAHAAANLRQVAGELNLTDDGIKVARE